MLSYLALFPKYRRLLVKVSVSMGLPLHMPLHKRTGSGRNTNFTIAKFGLKKLETSRCGAVQSTFRYLEPFWRYSRV